MNIVINTVVCWHDRATMTVGPTTDQRNWHCPDCGASRTTFPTDEERRAALDAAFAKASGERPSAPAPEGERR